MKLVDTSIKAPVAVAVGVLLILLFGLLTFFQIPIQLTPNVDKPQLTVTTRWAGASPNEIEREITDEQEEFLKNVEGLVKLTSESQDSQASVSLEFPPGTDIGEAMLRVSNKLEQVPSYPPLADKPVVTNQDARGNAVAWFILKGLPGNDRAMHEYRDLCEDVIKPAFERVSGVSQAGVFGGSEQELVVTVDPYALSARNITISQFVNALRAANRNISAGDYDEGKRRYIVRTLGEFEKPEDVEDVVVAQVGQQAVYVRDVATVRLGYKKADVSVRHFGEAGIAMNVQRSAGANVLEVMQGLRDAVEALNRDILSQRDLELMQVYDETIYINSALDLVQQNMFVGGFLAIAVLFLFLRSARSVVVIGFAIPISVIGTFAIMFLLGRKINVVSLAGMSFAIGMVVDNSIVVLENIYRHVQMGKDRWTAARKGAAEVWGAVLASTLTTMAVFVPILFMVDEAGQLFKDIAIAISAAVALSMIVAITVIPTMSARIFHNHKEGDPEEVEGWAIFGWARSMTDGIASMVHWLCGSVSMRLVTVCSLTLVAVAGAWFLTPPAEYLPRGNRNLVFAIILPPPGYNVEELTSMADKIETGLSPHFARYRGKEQENAEGPIIDNFFFVAAGRQVFMGAIARNDHEVSQITGLFARELMAIPGLFPIVQQASLFSGVGQSRSIEIQITGPELEQLVAMGGEIFGKVRGMMPGAQARPIPSLDLGNPEVRIKPDRILMSKLGLNADELGTAVDVLLDGRRVSEYKFQGKEMDLVVEGRPEYVSRSQDFAALPIATGRGKLVTLGSVADIEVTTGPEQINHIERNRTISIQVNPPDDIPLESAMQMINEQIVDPMTKQGRIGGLYNIQLAGTADDLDRTRNALGGNLLLAIVITFLLMAALFESFLYPAVILFSVPLAAVGGLAGLFLVNTFIAHQPLDVLTMLGFVILVGTVVNNAILIVHQSLNHIRDEGMVPRDAIRESVRTRIRPIFMSTTTSVFGMLPLVLFPGAGSELYRGLGSVVVGGLVVSTIFTLLVVPTLFSLVYDVRSKVIGIFSDEEVAA